MPSAVRDYRITRGETWKRLIVIRDRRTRRRRVPTDAYAALRIDTGEKAGDYYIPAVIIHEGAVELRLMPENTLWLPVGTFNWDLVAKVSRSPYFTSTTIDEVVVVKGALEVIEYDPITPMDTDLVIPTPLVPTVIV